jgi:hypothetical protein
VLLEAIQEGVKRLTWELETFAYAESYDEATGRYRGLQAGSVITLNEYDKGLLVKPEIAKQQLDAEEEARRQQQAQREQAQSSFSIAETSSPSFVPAANSSSTSQPTTPEVVKPANRQLRRFHGSVQLNPARVSLHAAQIAEEVIVHLTSLLGAKVRITLEIEAEVPDGVPDNVVRTVTENSRVLKFEQVGFEED